MQIFKCSDSVYTTYRNGPLIEVLHQQPTHFPIYCEDSSPPLDKFISSCTTMMKEALVSQCNDNEVRLAKDILCGVYGDELLEKPRKCNHVPDNPSARHEK